MEVALPYLYYSRITVTVIKNFTRLCGMHIILYINLATLNKVMCLSLSMGPKLLSNITCWEGLLSSASIQQLSVDGLVNRYLLLSLQNCPIDNYTVEKTNFCECSRVLSHTHRHTPCDITVDHHIRVGWEVNFFTSQLFMVFKFCW